MMHSTKNGKNSSLSKTSSNASSATGSAELEDGQTIAEVTLRLEHLLQTTVDDNGIPLVSFDPPPEGFVWADQTVQERANEMGSVPGLRWNSFPGFGKKAGADEAE